MADFEFLNDLAELQKKFFEAEEKIGRVDGESSRSSSRLSTEIVLAKLRRPFWENVAGQGYQADMALRKIARPEG